MLANLRIDWVVVEADGSRMLPVKAPGSHEPVVPIGTTLLVQVGAPLDNSSRRTSFPALSTAMIKPPEPTAITVASLNVGCFTPTLQLSLTDCLLSYIAENAPFFSSNTPPARVKLALRRGRDVATRSVSGAGIFEWYLSSLSSW
jgi:hypothetical protein